MSKFIIFLFHLNLIVLIQKIQILVEAEIKDSASERNQGEPLLSSSNDISLVDFQGLLYSEINNEVITRHRDDDLTNRSRPRPNGRYLTEEDVSLKVQEVWDGVVRHGWEMAQTLQNVQHRNLNKRTFKSRTNISPYVICSQSPNDKRKSGYQRLQSLLAASDIHLQDVVIIRNDRDKTCYHVSLDYEAATKLRSTFLTNGNDDDHYTLLPLTDLMKIQFQTMTTIYDESWTIPFIQQQDDWKRTVRVGLSTGHRVNLDHTKVLDMASSIIDDIQSLSQTGARKKRLRTLKAKDDEEYFSDAPSLSDLFSLTSLDLKKGGESRNLRQTREKVSESQWTKALRLGLESDHSCVRMFDLLKVNVHRDNQGFDIVLNPDSAKNKYSDRIEENAEKNQKDTMEVQNGIESERGIESENGIECKNGIECSASNTHCVASLIIGLATHPLVLAVETEEPIVPNDYEAQWITQSKRVNSRPLRDIGIDGSNQVISVLDSGVDINNEYFGPTDAKVFDEWDYSQRKIVRYDTSVGDREENRGGHGTKVSCVAAGKSQASDDNEADGIATGAKLHIFDIQDTGGAYKFPDAYTLFESMHATDNTPARIANGSFGTVYRPYPFSCKFFDEALYDKYQGDIYVASAGNDGLNQKSLHSNERTIGNPASCKNTIAVGASQSYGNKLTPGDIGIDYLAAFSSRGPTFDGRMKPDLVAPGASVLTAFAQENGKTVREYGTSVAAPVVAGNAALIRQYFEEGKLPCKQRNCDIDPSGSLVKAVLLNSAHTLKNVQVTLPWLEKKVLEEVHDYDNNQGMGLVQLDSTLPIPGHNNFSAVVRNNEVIQHNEVHDIYIKATPAKCLFDSYKRNFSATLTWYDPPGAMSCAKCLVDDLDIMVHSVTKRGVIRKNSEVFPNGGNWVDDENNVEQVRFQMKGARFYRIRISAANLSTAETKFSMIASGCFKEVQNPALRWN